jgi:mannose-6-phosphate isomerase-like protein (cupin superfamily)
MHRRNLSLLLASVIVVIAAVIVRARDEKHAAPQSAATKQSSSSATPLILQEGDGERRVRRPGGMNPAWPFIIKVDGQNGNAQDFAVFTEIMSPGQTIPFHMHHNAEEILILEQGGATVTVGDKRAVTGPHAVVFIPRETWVSLTNTGTESIHLYALFSRLGFENFMRARSVPEGQPATPMTADDIARARASGHATYWDTSKAPYPPGAAHP